MFSASRKLIVPLFVYLSLLLATAECHDGPLHLRDHANLNMKRLMKKRSPFPADGPAVLPSVVVGAGVIPTLPSSSSESASSTVSSQSTTSVSATSTSVSATSASVSASDSTSITTSASQSSSSSSTSSTVSTTSATTTAQTTEILNLTNAPVAPVSTVVPTITHTASVDAESTTPVSAPVAAVAAATKTKSTTLTVLIAVAASVGGIAIFWTIFRKWKLSSSKKFDERLNPIDWQPTAGEDGVIPTHRRVPSGSSSFHSGSGHNHDNSGGRSDALDHDFTALPNTSAPIGGYADLARGPSPLPPMQEHLTRGPSFNRAYDNGVPLHHQVGYGAGDAYGGAPRY